MMNLAHAICDRALAPGAAPEWVHLFPDGQMTGRDGRAFDMADPAALVLAFQSAGIDLPVDYEHQNDRPEARLSGPVPAAGWIKELKRDAGGLWARVEWTATARDLISNREYRFISPSFNYHPKTRAIVKLNGAGLVHNPNLHLTALARQETTMPAPKPPTQIPATPTLESLLAALGLADGATTTEALRAVLALLKTGSATTEDRAVMAEIATAFAPDPARYVPIEAVQGMLRERSTERATASEARAHGKVDAAYRQGYLTGGLRDWALALCQSDEAAFDRFLEKSGPVFAALTRPTHTDVRPPHAATFEDGPVASAICIQLGLKPGSLKA